MLDFLDARGLAVSDAQRERIVNCKDLEILTRWVRYQNPPSCHKQTVGAGDSQPNTSCAARSLNPALDAMQNKPNSTVVVFHHAERQELAADSNGHPDEPLVVMCCLRNARTLGNTSSQRCTVDITDFPSMWTLTVLRKGRPLLPSHSSIVKSVMLLRQYLRELLSPRNRRVTIRSPDRTSNSSVPKYS